MTIIKFSTVGIMNAMIDLGLLDLLLWISPEKNRWIIFLINTIAVLAAILNSYFWNKKWTFSRRKEVGKKERIQFFSQGLLNLLINDIVTVLMSSYFIDHNIFPLYISSNLSKGTAMITSSLFSYFIMKYVVFKKEHIEK